MASNPVAPCIASDSDIAGIGVRVSLYIQALLNVLCAVVFARDGHFTPEEASVLAESTKNLCLTSCALLLTAAIQSATTGLSVYHALIVLNLSWVNALSAVVIYFVALRQSRPRRSRPQRPSQSPSQARSRSPLVGPIQYSSLPAEMLIAIIFATVSYCGMGAFGIALWTKINRFGNADQQQCTPQVFLPIFGHNIPVTAPSLRKGSLAVYSISVIPFNMLPFISIGSIVVQIGSLPILVLVNNFLDIVFDKRLTITKERLFYGSGVVFTALAEITFITDTELMISRSAHLVQEGEETWTFGQTLAMVLVLVPLFQTVRAIWLLWDSRAERDSEEDEESKRQNKDEAEDLKDEEVEAKKELRRLISHPLAHPAASSRVGILLCTLH